MPPEPPTRSVEQLWSAAELFEATATKALAATSDRRYNICIHIYIYIQNIYTHVCIYIYIYIEREREGCTHTFIYIYHTSYVYYRDRHQTPHIIHRTYAHNTHIMWM